MRKSIVALGILAVVTALTLSYSMGLNTGKDTVMPTTTDNSDIVHHGVVCESWWNHLTGQWTDLGCQHNVYTLAGKKAVRDLLFANVLPTANFTWISIANCTQGPGTGQIDTGLCGVNNASAQTGQPMEYNSTFNCGMASQAGTWYNFTGWSGAGASNITWTFTDSCAVGTIYVNATGLYNASGGAFGTGAALLAENTFTTVSLSNADQLNVTWGVWTS